MAEDIREEKDAVQEAIELQEQEEKKPAKSVKAKKEEQKDVDMTERVPIMIPKGGTNEDSTLQVFVNEKGYIIPRGQEVYVPRFVADVVRAARRASEKRDNYVEEKLEESRRVQGL